MLYYNLYIGGMFSVENCLSTLVSTLHTLLILSLLFELV